MTDRLLTISEVADRLGVSTDTVKRRIRSAALAAFVDGRIVRVRESDLRAYISRGLTRRDDVAAATPRPRSIARPRRQRQSERPAARVVRLWDA